MESNKESKKKWETTDHRFVAFIDILGFKELVMRNTHKDIYTILNKISVTRKFIEKLSDEKDYQEIYFDAEIYSASFSDSIILFTKNDTKENFNLFIFVTNLLFASSINNSIPVKGAIAHGEISVNKSKQIYFGQPIIDAYLLEEEVSYFGIVAHNSIEKYIKEKYSDFKNKQKYLIEAYTPLKCGMITHQNLNWFKVLGYNCKSGNIKEFITNSINSFKVNISGSPRRYIENTLDFFLKESSKLDIE